MLAEQFFLLRDFGQRGASAVITHLEKGVERSRVRKFTLEHPEVWKASMAWDSGMLGNGPSMPTKQDSNSTQLPFPVG